MGFNLGPMDYWNLPYLPLMFFTAKEAREQWDSLWDAKLTQSDRRLLKQLVIFWLLPVMVLLHELGHVAAIKLFGGKVVEFHYTFVYGYVVPSGIFTPDQLVWLYFSGNLLQIILGMISLALAFVFRSPPVVALLVYLSLFTIAGTAVLYALLSLTDLYGDWIAIYTSSAQPLVAQIAVFHAAVVGFLFFCLYSPQARIWYTCRTQPGWEDAYRKLRARVDASPTASNWLDLGWCYCSAGLLDAAEDCVKQIKLRDPAMLSALMLAGSIAERRGNAEKAVSAFRQVAQSSGMPPRHRVRAYIAIAEIQLMRGEIDNAFATYETAIAVDPTVADPHFYKAVLFNDAERFIDAEHELRTTYNLDWIDQSLQHAAIEELEQSRRGRSQSQ